MDTQPRFILRYVEHQRRQAAMQTMDRGRTAGPKRVAPQAGRNDKPGRLSYQPESSR